MNSLHKLLQAQLEQIRRENGGHFPENRQPKSCLDCGFKNHGLRRCCYNCGEYLGQMAEQADAPDSKPGVFGREGSTPSLATKK